MADVDEKLWDNDLESARTERIAMAHTREVAVAREALRLAHLVDAKEMSPLRAAGLMVGALGLSDGAVAAVLGHAFGKEGDLARLRFGAGVLLGWSEASALTVSEECLRAHITQSLLATEPK